jgi:hypothetical protein
MNIPNLNTKNALLCFLTGFVSLSLFFSSPAAAACTPVVYAFRHAEDLNGPPTELTPVGMEHANLYIEMITAFELTNNYCPVKFVYSVNQVKPGGEVGTTNPYFTARPLANIVMNLNPIIEIDNKRIDEFLEMSNIGPVRFRDVMLDKVEGGSSVALFWTSQGLHNLGEAIVPGFNIPEEPKPPRNAAYVFEFNGSDGFIAPPKVDQYIQCFNWANFRAPGDMSSSKYWCGNASNGNLSSSIAAKYLYKLHGRICDTDDLIPVTQAGYYGYCVSPAST